MKPRKISGVIIGGIHCSVFTRELSGPLAAPIGCAFVYSNA
jgi:hypothetical protein